MLEIKNLHVEIDGKVILSGLNLLVKAGEVHVLMGPNGAGKSTLSKVLAGHPHYQVTQGEILFKGENLLEKNIEERAHMGLFIGFQYPVEISGVSNRQFLFEAYNAHLKSHVQEAISEEAFEKIVRDKVSEMQMKPEFIDRDVNTGFSGGEKKRNEILQMVLLNPTFAILDETDSGLDIDAMKIVSEGINRHMNEDKALILITHYQQFLKYIKPHVVHVLLNGKIAKSGDMTLVQEIEKGGYAMQEALL